MREHAAGGYPAGMTPLDPNQKDPKDWTPEDAMAVNAVPDDVRLHADPSETEIAQRSDGAVVDPDPGPDDPESDEQP